MYHGSRNLKNNKVMIPYSKELNVTIGDVFIQQQGANSIELKIIDISSGPSLDVGTSHPKVLTLKVTNLSSAPHLSLDKTTNYNIGNLTAHNVQVGDENTLNANVTLQDFVEKISKTNDEEAKQTLRKLLSNRTIITLLGASASTLLSLF